MSTKFFLMRVSTSIAVLSVLIGSFVASVASAAWDIGEAFDEAGGLGIATTDPFIILERVINAALYMIGFISILVFIVAGIMYLLSAGDEKKALAAKTTIMNAMIGIAVALIGVTVLYAISTLLGAGGAVNGL